MQLNGKPVVKYPNMDFETRSEVDVRDVGAYRYAMDKSTEVICLSYDLLDGKGVRLWHRFMPTLPHDLIEYVRAGGIVEAHNAEFEYCIWNYVLNARGGWPYLNVSQLRCTAARAAAHALPRSLEGLGAALDTHVKKNVDGKKTMQKLSKPRMKWKAGSSEAKWHEEFEDLEKLFIYNVDDVLAEQSAAEKLLPLKRSEQEIWELTTIINERGFYADLELCKIAISFLEQFEKELLAELFSITAGEVRTARQVATMRAWLETRNVTAENLTAGTVKTLLTQDMDPDAKRVLEIRQLLGRSSVSKYEALIRTACFDSRIRGTFLYHAASTGRYGGRYFQPQNLARGTYSDVNSIIRCLAIDDYEFFKEFYPDVFGALSSCIRGMIKAAPGYELFAADFNAIEARVLFWIAGETLGIEMYRKNVDIYEDMARVIFNLPRGQKVTKEQRQLGKQAILGCLAKGTIVKCKTGYKKIEEINQTDLVWNGFQWTRHNGLLAKGMKNVIQINSLALELTPDHWVLLNQTWRTAGEIALIEATHLQNPEIKTEILLSSRANLKGVPNGVSLLAAYAETKKKLESTNFTLEKDFFVLLVNSLLPDKKAETPEEIATLLVTDVLERVGQLVSTTLKKDVRTPMIKTIRGMVVAEFNAPSTTLEHFWNILLRFLGLTNGDSLSTELITMETMNPAIYELSLKKLTTKTVETFDLHNVENGNRFQAGKAIVHNCGYGMGPKKFKLTCESYGMNVDEALSERAIQSYRQKYRMVVNFWYGLEDAAREAIKSRRLIIYEKLKLKVENGFLFIQLPSGRRLSYYNPHLAPDRNGFRDDAIYYWGVDSKTKQWTKQATYGGKLTENVVQAIARDVMVESMKNLTAQNYPIIMTVHDEIIAEVKIDERDLEDFKWTMARPPEWGLDIPLKVEGWADERFKK
jgi:hypothetical protein